MRRSGATKHDGREVMLKRAFTIEQMKHHDRLEDELLRLVTDGANEQTRLHLLMSRQLWRENGQWSRYYQAREGRVHGSRYCPALSESTRLIALWEYSAELIEVVASAGLPLCRKCFPEAPGKPKKKARVCPGSGERSPLRWAGEQHRQDCPRCGKSVLVTPSGVLRRHG
jgi:hypothetical protein